MKFLKPASPFGVGSDREYGSSGDDPGGYGRMTKMGRVVESGRKLMELSRLATSTHGKLRPLDYAAFALSSVPIALDIHEIWTKKPKPVPSEYFQLHAEWRQIHAQVVMYGLDGLEVQEQPVESHQVSIKGKVVLSPWTAEVGGTEVGWYSPPGPTFVIQNLFTKDEGKLRLFARRRMWDCAGAGSLMRFTRLTGRFWESVPYEMAADLQETDTISMLRRRTKAFVAAGRSRSFLLEGEPGTGKSTAAVYLAREFGLRAAIVEASELADSGPADLIDLLRPDVLIINDIDRLHPTAQVQLLAVLEQVKKTLKLIFATTNDRRRLIEAIRRPGRLDDFVSIHGLDLEEVQRFAPDLPELHEAMVGWPIAYVLDMQHRFAVIGDDARREFDEVRSRLCEVREAGGRVLVAS